MPPRRSPESREADRSNRSKPSRLENKKPCSKREQGFGKLPGTLYSEAAFRNGDDGVRNLPATRRSRSRCRSAGPGRLPPCPPPPGGDVLDRFERLFSCKGASSSCCPLLGERLGFAGGTAGAWPARPGAALGAWLTSDWASSRASSPRAGFLALASAARPFSTILWRFLLHLVHFLLDRRDGAADLFHRALEVGVVVEDALHVDGSDGRSLLGETVRPRKKVDARMRETSFSMVLGTWMRGWKPET